MDYIHWAPQLELFSIFGFPVRWYGILWIIGLIGAVLIVCRINKNLKQKIIVEQLFFYCYVGVLVGARLGHCIFYGLDYYFSSLPHFIEMFVPIRFLPNGDCAYIGYAGMASHGGTIGLAIALILYCKHCKQSPLLVVDAVAFAAPFCAMMIRIGNLINSEIIGRQTDVPWAFVFDRVDQVPRHPAQLYEALFYGLVFVVGVILYRNTSFAKKLGSGFYFGYCLTTIFTFRFFVEYLKEVQEDFEQNMLLDMGQILSIPFILVGLYFLITGLYKSRKIE